MFILTNKLFDSFNCAISLSTPAIRLLVRMNISLAKENSQLQAHDNEVLERAANYVESGNKYHEVSEGRERCVNKARAAMSCAETIRALKEVK